ncbi:GFA family protein [Shewanella surugensis]|uniref:GFA family protein n=1 Tax=Shewanella surugensis TaxID=212020 RepID=A0ABT0LEY1_9GAMM|nr:GFA family protein [Shewanella surugensis]MCL1126258.1 GFA family protein [Shewanella surugensis]
MSKKVKGSCLCQAVKFEIEGEFEHFFLCHCAYCRKDTGSAHAANLFSTTARLVWQAGEDQITTFNLPATRHIKSFCATCGAALPNVQMQGKLLAVPAGSLDEAVNLKPSAHLFGASRAHWDDGLAELPVFDTFPE